MAKRFKSNDVKPGTCSRHPAILGLPKFDYNADFESRKLKNCIFQKKNNEEEIFFPESERLYSNRVDFCDDHNGCYEFGGCKKS